MTFLEQLIKKNRQVSIGLARTFRAMPPDKQTWRPLEMGRSALDQVQECAGLNRFALEIFRTGEVPGFDTEEFARLKQEHDTADMALSLLKESTDQLVAAIEAFPVERLDEAITLPFGGGMPSSFGDLMFVTYWNMAYHVGQINYIQTLYGDNDMH